MLEEGRTLEDIIKDYFPSDAQIEKLIEVFEPAIYKEKLADKLYSAREALKTDEEIAKMAGFLGMGEDASRDEVIRKLASSFHVSFQTKYLASLVAAGCLICEENRLDTLSGAEKKTRVKDIFAKDGVRLEKIDDASIWRYPRALKQLLENRGVKLEAIPFLFKKGENEHSGSLKQKVLHMLEKEAEAKNLKTIRTPEARSSPSVILDGSKEPQFDIGGHDTVTLMDDLSHDTVNIDLSEIQKYNLRSLIEGRTFRHSWGEHTNPYVYIDNRIPKENIHPSAMIHGSEEHPTYLILKDDDHYNFKDTATAVGKNAEIGEGSILLNSVVSAGACILSVEDPKKKGVLHANLLEGCLVHAHFELPIVKPANQQETQKGVHRRPYRGIGFHEKGIYLIREQIVIARSVEDLISQKARILSKSPSPSKGQKVVHSVDIHQKGLRRGKPISSRRNRE